jgi:superfamily II DNA or RNA helicase
MLGLRDYQVAAHDAVLREFGFAPWWDGERPTSKKTVANLATSAGKTIISAFLCQTLRKMGKRILFVGDREELIMQPVEKFHKACGITAAIHRGTQSASPMADVVVASIQTLSRRLPGGRPFDVIIDDEAHRNTDGRQKIHDAYPDANVLGITATAFRKNMADLSKWYKTVAFELGTFDLIGEGYITPVKVLTMPLEVDLAQVHQRSGDFDQDEVSIALEPHYVAIAAAIKKYANNRRILAFLPLIKSSQEFVSVMQREGLTARHCDGASDNRNEIIEQFENGEFQILSNSQVFSTGVDFIRCDCMLNLAATRSRGEYRQRAGRIMRLLPGVIDPGGVTLPTAEERKAAIAASEKPDCIAEGTMILTDIGLVPIERVTKSMLVWDGTCYCKHDGAIYKGEQETITYAGLTATPTHLVWTQNGWITFAEAAREAAPIASTADGWRAIREVEGYFRSVSESTARQSHPDAYGMCNLRQAGMALAWSPSKWPIWLPQMWYHQAPSSSSEMAIESCDGAETTMRESERQRIRTVRRSRHSFQFSKHLRSLRVGYGESWTGEGQATRPHQQRWTLRGRQHSLVNSPSKSVAYQKDTQRSSFPSLPIGAPGGSICRFYAGKDGRHDDFSADRGPLSSPIPQTKRRVWDILNCGPLHRFTANGLLVHNCLILDVLWQTERIGLAGAASIIADTEQEEEEIAKRVAKKRSAEELADIREEVKRAKEEELRKELEKAAKDQARKASLRDAREIVLELGNHSLLNYEPATASEQLPVNHWQKEKLERYGFTAQSITCAGHASQIIDSIEGRQRDGMAPIQAFAQLRAAGVEDPARMTMNDAIRTLGTKFPCTFGKKHQGVPLDEVPKRYWDWLTSGADQACRNSWKLVQEKHPAVYRYVQKIVYGKPAEEKHAIQQTLI